MRLSNALTGLQHDEILCNLNLPLFDLGGDLEGVEEGNLGGVHSGCAGWDDDIDGSSASDFGSAVDSVCLNDGLQVEDGLFGEDEADFSSDEILEGVQLSNGVLAELLQVIIIGVIFLKFLTSGCKGLAEEGLNEGEELHFCQ